MQTTPSDLNATGHGLSLSGDPACCKLKAEGVFDCVQCIQKSFIQLENWPTREKNAALLILRYLEGREEEGVELGQLKV